MDTDAPLDADDLMLMADRLDGRPVNDGRYFQISPGAHELQVRLQFDVPSGGQAQVLIFDLA